MKRRTVLASIGTLGALGAAGCVASDDPNSPGGGSDGDSTTPPKDDPTTDPGVDPTTDPGDDPTTDPDDGTEWGPGSTEPFETATVGTREDVPFPENNGPHHLRVWNGADGERELGLTLATNDGTVFERTLAFPADGWMRLTLNEPASYELAVAVGGERAGTVTVGRKWFDCNGSATNVAVNAEGAVDSTSISTAVACPGPAVAGRSFTHGEGRCGTGGEASVAFREGTVAVTGAVSAPTPCFDAALESARLENAEDHADGSDDVLVVTVATGDRHEGACVDCVGEVPYDLSVTFDHAYPSNVRVVHASRGGRRTVREVSRSP